MGRGSQVQRLQQEAKLLLGILKGQTDGLQHLTLQC